MGQFARVRITRLLEKSLKRCVNLIVDGEKEQRLILICYEKMPHFCQPCGRVGHLIRHCEDKEAEKENLALEIG